MSLVRRQRHWSRVVDVHGWTPVHGPRADRGPEIVPGHQTPQCAERMVRLRLKLTLMLSMLLLLMTMMMTMMMIMMMTMMMTMMMMRKMKMMMKEMVIVR